MSEDKKEDVKKKVVNRNYNPDAMTPRFKKPPVIDDLAHIPFTDMEYEQEAKGSNLNIIAFEKELMTLLAKYGLGPEEDLKPSTLIMKKTKGIAIALPKDAKGNLIVEIKRQDTETHDIFVNYNYAHGKLVRSLIRHPHTFLIGKDVANCRRVFTVGSMYQTTPVVEPPAYEGTLTTITRVNGKPFVEKSFLIDGIKKPYFKATLPDRQYRLLNGITTKEEPSS